MKKIPVWKNVVLIISGLFVVIVATFAWFYNGRSANGDNLAAEVEDARFIQISGDGNSWSDGLDIEFGVKQKFKEMSGNGISLFTPVYDTVEDANGGFSTQITSFDLVNEKNEFYYEKTLHFRGDVIQNIYVAPDSYVQSIDAQGNGYIDGAVRVAFFEVDEYGAETLKLIWAPNSAVEYSEETNAFTREGIVEPYYYYQASANPMNIDTLEQSSSDVVKISTDGTDEQGCGYNEEYKFMWTNGQNMPKNAPSVLTVDGDGDDDLFGKKLKIKVWLEGHDRECVNLLSGQKFTIMLHFNAKRGE